MGKAVSQFLNSGSTASPKLPAVLVNLFTGLEKYCIKLLEFSSRRCHDREQGIFHC
jgi:hypothetical protein